MTRREAVAGVIGAVGAAAVLVATYEAGCLSVGPSTIASAGGARAGTHGPGPQPPASNGSGADDPWRAANASLIDQARECRHRLAASEVQLKKVTTKLASVAPDAGRAGPLQDPFNPASQEDWKYLAKHGVVRAKNFCFPKADWQPSDGELDAWGLGSGDVAALTRAFGAAAQRIWQATRPACAKLVGAEEADRLGDDPCFTIILHSFPEAQWNADAQLVSDIRAGNVAMPTPDKLDALATRMLAMTSAASDLESDLAPTFGPELAHEIATGPMPWGSCTVQLGNKLPMPPDEP
jgi:hypothetical protein